MKNTTFVGILNITPDSFSDGGKLYQEGQLKHSSLLHAAERFLSDGAQVLDIGGEASGPGSVDVSLEEELARVIPALYALRAEFPQAILSVDTYKSEVAQAALEAGAQWINDITAGRGDDRIGDIVAAFDATIVLMYSKDLTARTTREPVQYQDVVHTVKEFLKQRIEWAKSKGIKKIILDPGMGAFVSGEPRYSWELIDRIEKFHDLDYPLLVGTSRKGFLGEDRLAGTLYTTTLLRGKVDYLRVHDVIENVTCS